MNSNETKHFQLILIHEKFDAMFKGYVFLQMYCFHLFSKVIQINFPQWHKINFLGGKIQIPGC